MQSFSPARHGEVSLLFSDTHSARLMLYEGPGYRDDAIFNLSTMEPYSIEHQYNNFSKIASHIVLFLPRTSNLNQIANHAKDGSQIQVMHYCMTGASKVSITRVVATE
jgi:hypothetical protein